jgi:3-oxoacyl-[acyl-carrier-protein] synthase III
VKRAGIIGLGLWVPPTIRRNDAWPASFVDTYLERREAAKTADLMHVERVRAGRPYEELFQRHAAPYDRDPFKGAVERRVAPAATPSVEGDTRAVRSALEDAGVAPADVSLILSSAVVPDRVCPPNATAIQHLSGCVNAAALGVEAYCASAGAQLEIAAAMVETGRARIVVCVQSHQITRTMNLAHPSSPVFGDASSAFVVGEVASDRGLVGVVSKCEGSLAGAVTWNYEANLGGNWRCGAQGEAFLGTEDPVALRRLVDNALAYPIDAIRRLCTKTETPIDSVAALSMIQPLVWYQAAVADGLGLDVARAPSTHARYAHIGGCAVVANLIEARDRGLLTDRTPVILYGHGAGLSLSTVMLRWA